jgi:hypothetical protein
MCRRLTNHIEYQKTREQGPLPVIHKNNWTKPLTVSEWTPERGRGASAPSIIRKKGEIQRGEQVPSDGSLALPKDVVMEPLGLEGLLNTNLDI